MFLKIKLFLYLFKKIYIIIKINGMVRNKEMLITIIRFFIRQFDLNLIKNSYLKMFVLCISCNITNIR